jgi:hypothetical protein
MKAILIAAVVIVGLLVFVNLVSTPSTTPTPSRAHSGTTPTLEQTQEGQRGQAAADAVLDNSDLEGVGGDSRTYYTMTQGQVSAVHF